ncbi:MAG: hypothetical protein KAW56_09000 [Candidatus Marinimicrobia bacterium]|nr:hypothetical protein [Candidatus Neomarinimicrobiota bacterium]
MEDVFKRCLFCFDASFDPKCRLPRRAINSLATKILFIVMLVIGHFTYLEGGIK